MKTAVRQQHVTKRGVGEMRALKIRLAFVDDICFYLRDKAPSGKTRRQKAERALNECPVVDNIVDVLP